MHDDDGLPLRDRKKLIKQGPFPQKAQVCIYFNPLRVICDQRGNNDERLTIRIRKRVRIEKGFAKRFGANRPDSGNPRQICLDACRPYSTVTDFAKLRG